MPDGRWFGTDRSGGESGGSAGRIRSIDLRYGRGEPRDATWVVDCPACVGCVQLLDEELHFAMFDEATTALDPKTEAAICKTLKRLAATMTVLATSHQRALAEIADRTSSCEMDPSTSWVHDSHTPHSDPYVRSSPPLTSESVRRWS